MGSRGPKSKSASEKELTGNPGHRPIQQSAKVKAAAGIPQCPSHLSEEAREEWKRVTAELQSIGLLTKVDRGALAAYCQAWARHVQAERQRDIEGDWIEGAHGGLVISPSVKISESSARIMLMFQKEFGLTPASRGRLDHEPPEEEDEFDRMQRQREAAAASPPVPMAAAAKRTKAKPKKKPAKNAAPKKKATAKRGRKS